MTYTLTEDDIRRCREISIGNRELIMDIVRAVSEQTDIPVAYIQGKSMKRDITLARWLICYLAVEAGFSLAAIGRVLRKDHASVRHGVQKERERRAASATYIATEADLCQDKGGGEVREKPSPASSSDWSSPHDNYNTGKAAISQPHCSVGA